MDAPRRLIVIYALIVAVGDVIVALPGGPSYESRSGFVFAVSIGALVVWRLWHGSQIAWCVGVLLALIDQPLAFIMGAPDLGSLLMAFSLSAQLVLLVMLQVAWFRSRRSVAPS